MRMARNVVVKTRSTPGRAPASGVFLPCPNAADVFILRRVYPRVLSPKVRIVAPDSLQLAGLRRAAEEAGLLSLDASMDSDVVGNDELSLRAAGTAGELTLRAAGTTDPVSAFDVVVEADHIRLRLERAPDAVVWEHLRHLVELLLGSTEQVG